MIVHGARIREGAEDVRKVEDRILARAFAPIDALALGSASGAVLAAGLFLATSWLILKGGPIVGPNLGLLAQYFPGFRVTWVGALVGAAYGATAGFALGWGVALLRNAVVFGILRKAKARDESDERKRLLDYV